MSENFLSRWSKRKLEVRAQEQLAEEVTVLKTEAPLSGVDSGQSAAAGELSSTKPLEQTAATQPELPLPTEEDLHAVEQGGDIKAFMVDKVSTELKNKAFKALFSRPEFNVMDGLDIYIDDYSKFTPLSQEDIGKMTLSKQLLSRPDLEIPKKGDINAGLEKLESALASEEDSASDALDKTEMPAQVSAVEADNPNETRVIPDSLQGVDFNDELKNVRLNHLRKNNQYMVHFVCGVSNPIQTKCTTPISCIQDLVSRWLILNKKISYAALAQVLQLIAK
ncbi:hypothetical protein BSZ31_12325 [Limnobacter sp. SAORIC-690]|uniref:DUF3306 domain-containing protein n=1 Tax=Limnobacter sp. SAORIC-690 TaxID=1923970 RepID=UPI000CF3B765|nr:DUF3306 domain-containing protein [Limnobacter sp. SAORIC-690]PQJ25633.1 hypothetical protein BSZ31_12325 [Limnobacter sp. SAORIC-690]